MLITLALRNKYVAWYSIESLRNFSFGGHHHHFPELKTEDCGLTEGTPLSCVAYSSPLLCSLSDTPTTALSQIHNIPL